MKKLSERDYFRQHGVLPPKQGKEVNMTESNLGHNGAGQKLLALVIRVENLEADKQAINDDINEVLKEGENQGFDKKIIKTIVKIRKDKAEFEKNMALVDTYMREIGDQLDFDFGADYEKDAIEELIEAA
jgi:uncharacterized protein (UPF0335 family)